MRANHAGLSCITLPYAAIQGVGRRRGDDGGLASLLRSAGPVAAIVARRIVGTHKRRAVKKQSCSGDCRLRLLTCQGAGGMDGGWVQEGLQLLAVCPFTDCGCPCKYRKLYAARLQGGARAPCLVYVIDGVSGIP